MKKTAIFVLFICLLAITAPMKNASAMDQAALQKLYEAAKAEGEVILHTGARLDNELPVVKEFEKKYPGVQCKVFSAAATGIAARVIMEHQAGKLSLDVGGTMTHMLMPLVERDLLVKFDLTKTSDVDPSLILVDGGAVIFGDLSSVWVRNTNLVSDADAPRTWEDLLDPKWKGGKISMRAMGASLGGLFVEWRKNPQKIEAYLKKLAGQEVVPGTRFALIEGRVTNGESPLGLIYGSSVTRLQEEGAPIKPLPISPTANAAFAFFIPKDSPHPNAAKLLLSWLTSSEGRKLRADLTGSGLASQVEDVPMAKVLFDNKIEYHRISINEADQFNRFSKMVEETMGFTPK